MIHKEQNLYKLCQLDFKRSNSLLAKKKKIHLWGQMAYKVKELVFNSDELSLTPGTYGGSRELTPPQVVL